ncbi:uncharacterized protein LOC135848257 isoform X2 [Planococcus citri]
MEVEMNLELEMAEVRPRVYDIVHPTPVPLAQLSAIVTSFEVWRYEMNTHRMRNNLSDFCKTREYYEYNIKLKTILPDLPCVILDLIREYIRKFQRSLQDWFNRHYETVFKSYNCSQNCILNEFDDFVTDFKGDIDYDRTAERVMQCDRLDDTVKFKIACMYCLEDDIRRLWPPVREAITSIDVNSYDCDQLQYWIGILTNQLDKTYVFKEDHVTTCEEMFPRCATSKNRSSMEYFWNRVRPNSQRKKASDMLDYDDSCLARFILPKLDDQQLSEFVNTYGCSLMTAELLEHQVDEGIVVIPTWMHIRDFMNESQFLELSQCMWKWLLSDNSHYRLLFFCQEIWNTAPYDLRQSTVRKILSNTELFNRPELFSQLNNENFVKFLLNILLSASIDERSSFWNNCWHHLIAVARCEYLQQFIKLCFGNEDAITQFKTNVMPNSEHLRRFCIALVKGASFVNFEKLNDLLKFCYPEAQQAKNFKQELLRLAFLGEDCQFCRDIVRNYSYNLNHFINETYGVADLSVDFKKQLLMSPAFEEFISFRVNSNNIYCLTEIGAFVDVFKPTEQTLVQIKTRTIDYFKESLTGDRSGRDLLNRRSLNRFLLWCLGSDAEVKKFRHDYALRIYRNDW